MLVLMYKGALYALFLICIPKPEYKREASVAGYRRSNGCSLKENMPERSEKEGKLKEGWR